MSYDVTIGIPVYRVEDYIERTMTSVLMQTYPNIEFLIVFASSHSHTTMVLSKLAIVSLRKLQAPIST